jgi:hypothetical protein
MGGRTARCIGTATPAATPQPKLICRGGSRTALICNRARLPVGRFAKRPYNAHRHRRRPLGRQPSPRAPHRRLLDLERSRPIPEITRPVIARPKSVGRPSRKQGARRGRPRACPPRGRPQGAPLPKQLRLFVVNRGRIADIQYNRSCRFATPRRMKVTPHPTSSFGHPLPSREEKVRTHPSPQGRV